MISKKVALRTPGFLSAFLVLAATLIFFFDLPDRVEFWLRGPANIAGFALISIVLAVLLAIGNKLTPKIAWSALGILAIAVIGLQPVGAVLLFGLASLSSGVLALLSAQPLMRRLRISVRPGREPIILTIGTGSGLLSCVLWAASHFPVNTAASHTLIYAGICALAAMIVTRRVRSHYLVLARRVAGSIVRAPAIALVPVSTMAIMLAGLAGLPEFGTDSVAVYQSYFAHLETRTFWHHDPAIATWSLQPLGGLHQAASVYLIGGELAPRLLNVAWFLGATWATAQVAAITSRSAWAAWAAAAVIISIPVILNISGNFFYDNASALWLSCAVLAIVATIKHRRDHGALILTFAVCIAAAAATKHTNWVIAPILLIVMLWSCRRSGSEIAASLVATAIAGSLLVIPIIVVAWIKSGNPVFPYYNQIFLSPYYSPSQHSTPHAGYLDWDVLVRLVFDTRSFSPQDPRGAAGLAPLFLLPGVIAALIATNPRRYWLVLTALLGSLLLVSSMQNDLRLLFPLLICAIGLSIGLISGASETSPFDRRTILLATGVTVAVQFLLLPTGSWNVPYARPDALINDTIKEEWLATRNPVAAINAALDGVPGTDGRRLYLSTRIGQSGAVTVPGSWHALRFRNQLFNARNQDELAALLTDIAPDVVILGTQSSRRWIPESFYPILMRNTEHHQVVLGHQIFHMGTEVAFSASANMDAQTERLVDESRAGTGAVNAGRTRLTFAPTTQSTSGFQLRFEYSCSVSSTLTVVISARSAGRTGTNRRERLPCLGHNLRGEADLRINSDSVSPDSVVVSVSTDGENIAHTLFDLRAGFKPALDTHFGYTGPLQHFKSTFADGR